MKNVNELVLEATTRMENHIEPTGEDWWLFRKIYFSRCPFIFSKKKQALCDYLYEEHLMKHTQDEMNKEEVFTYRILLNDSLEKEYRYRVTKPWLCALVLSLFSAILSILSMIS